MTDIDVLSPGVGGWGEPPSKPPFNLGLLDLEPPEEDDFHYDPTLAALPFAWTADMDTLFDDDDWPTPVFSDDLLERTVNGVSSTDSQWTWYDAEIIAVERPGVDAETVYEVGAVDLFQDSASGEVQGNYLPIADFAHPDAATAFYQQLQGELHALDTPRHQIVPFAETHAVTFNPDAAWQIATPEQYAAYHALSDWDGDIDADVPPPALDNPLLQTARDWGAVVTPWDDALTLEAMPPEGEAHFRSLPHTQALHAIGIDAGTFDTDKEPPPFVDRATGTAYWIGVFQPNREDDTFCVTSILSLGRNPDTGAMEAQLAPCAQGDWDKAYTTAEHLIGVAEHEGIDRCFDTAAGMALAADQFDLWNTERGIPLAADVSAALGRYAASEWDIEL